MHRPGYTGRKLQLDAGPRRALRRGLVTSLVLHEAITTTEPKAKETAPYFERLVTYAKKGTLASARQLRAELLTENAVQKLLIELKPAFDERQGGYTRIVKLPNRRGDNAPMVRLSLVVNDDKRGQYKPAVTKKVAKKAAAKAAKAPEPEAPKTTESKTESKQDNKAVEAAK
jgi:large subunit ribosomal protein L17